MNAKLKVESPEDVQFTVTLTASAKEFELIRDDLNGRTYAADDFKLVLNNLLGQARKIYWAEESHDG